MNTGASLRYYAELTEKVQRFGQVEQRSRWVAFTSLANWPEALARHVDPERVVSLRFAEDYRKPHGIEAELIE